jgi:hypothetical protein
VALRGKISRDHLIPVAFFAKRKISLRRKHLLANSVINIGVAHRACNSSRNASSFVKYWKKYPKYEAQAKIAIARLFREGPIAKKDVPLMKEIFRQMGALLKDDGNEGMD